MTERKTPEVGDGATLYVGSDRYPYTIVRVAKNLKRIWAKRDDFEPTDGHDYYGGQKYTFLARPDRGAELFTLRKTGHYIKKGDALRWGSPLLIGKRDAYMDPHF